MGHLVDNIHPAFVSCVKLFRWDVLGSYEETNAFDTVNMFLKYIYNIFELFCCASKVFTSTQGDIFRCVLYKWLLYLPDVYEYHVDFYVAFDILRNHRWSTTILRMIIAKRDQIYTQFSSCIFKNY